jgi:hypothetical protein
VKKSVQDPSESAKLQRTRRFLVQRSERQLKLTLEHGSFRLGSVGWVCPQDTNGKPVIETLMQNLEET